MNVLTPKTLTTPADLAAAGLVSQADLPAIDALSRRYATAIPAEIVRVINSTGAAIARQFVPDARELETRPEERSDPIGDHTHAPVKGVVHRYPDRVLLMPTLACAVYCRFCF